MLQADAYFDMISIYDEETKTIHWYYESDNRKEHDKKIKEFENQVTTYMRCLQKGDSDYAKTIAIYDEFNSRMKYDINVEDRSSYHALMEGTGIVGSKGSDGKGLLYFGMCTVM